MANTTARLGLPTLAPSQAQKHVTHNEALQLLDRLTQLVLAGLESETPPAVPEAGECHALGLAPTGAWAGQAGQLAQWVDPAWQFTTPQEGWCAWDAGTARLVVWQAGAWAPVLPDLDNLERVGIGTAADGTNRLAVSADAVLLSHDGAGHQLKINKASAGETGSLLYQSGWSGHAEMGLTGDNDFHLKVSPDGSTWTEALVVDATSGHVSGAAVQASATDVTPGRLARADHAYGPGNLVGGVSEAAGVPTGAVVESGSNANGSYTRWADGTQHCWQVLNVGSILAFGNGTPGDLYRTAYASWTFPVAFVDGAWVLNATAQTDTPTSSGTVQMILAVGGHPLAIGPGTGARHLQAVRLGDDSTDLDALIYCMVVGRWF